MEIELLLPIESACKADQGERKANGHRLPNKLMRYKERERERENECERAAENMPTKRTVGKGLVKSFISDKSMMLMMTDSIVVMVAQIQM